MEYMSQEGYDELVAELRQLETVELPRVRDAIAEARDKGDLSENFEYRAAKREQWRLLGRIRFKQKVLEHARVIDKSRLQADCVGLLSKVSITNLGNNRSMTYTITLCCLRVDSVTGRMSIRSSSQSRKLADEPCNFVFLTFLRSDRSYSPFVEAMDDIFSWRPS